MPFKPVSILLISLIAVAGLTSAYTQWTPGGCVQEFTTGAVLLATGDTLHGPIKLYWELDMISLPIANQVTRAFTAGQVKIFAVQGGHLLREVVDPNAAAIPQRLTAVSPYVIVGRSVIRPWVSPLTAWDQVSQNLADERQVARQPVQQAAEDVRLFRTFSWNQDKEGTHLLTPAFFEQLTNGPYLLLRRQRLESATVAADQRTRFAPFILTDHFYVADSMGKVQHLAQPRQDLLKLVGVQGPALRAYARQHQLRFDNAAQLSELVTYANANLLAK